LAAKLDGNDKLEEVLAQVIEDPDQREKLLAELSDGRAAEGAAEPGGATAEDAAEESGGSDTPE
jgi:hypothetical protein